MPNLLLIKELAHRKNISIPEIAKRVGISAQGLRKAIKNNSTTQSTLNKIANVLQVDVNVFHIYDSIDDYLANEVIEQAVNDLEIEYKRAKRIEILEKQIEQQIDYIALLKMEVDKYRELLHKCQNELNALKSNTK